MGKNKGNKSSKSKGGTHKVQDKSNNARESDSRREALRRRLQMKHRERSMNSESPESVLALALSYANCGKVAKACETFGTVPAEFLEPHRERYACLLLDNEQADLARAQIDLSKNTSEPRRTANLYTRALIEFIASYHLEESTKEDAEKTLQEAFAHNPFVAEAIVWNSFDELLADDRVLEKMPEADKLQPEEVAITYLICWGQLELWQDSTANEWLLEQLWGSEELPTMPAPTGRLRQRWISARSAALEEWMEAQSD
eukprot:GEMP01063003.1.p1 GENE.GEMP01063003.1~~GEMP01063003.1.p1  ORF type:complete len:268 (+),score=64.82 GEMP01063003.1:33-806(+)